MYAFPDILLLLRALNFILSYSVFCQLLDRCFTADVSWTTLLSDQSIWLVWRLWATSSGYWENLLQT